jgi:hypothetical protein
VWRSGGRCVRSGRPHPCRRTSGPSRATLTTPRAQALYGPEGRGDRTAHRATPGQLPAGIHPSRPDQCRGARDPRRGGPGQHRGVPACQRADVDLGHDGRFGVASTAFPSRTLARSRSAECRVSMRRRESDKPRLATVLALGVGSSIIRTARSPSPRADDSALSTASRSR